VYVINITQLHCLIKRRIQAGLKYNIRIYTI